MLKIDPKIRIEAEMLTDEQKDQLEIDYKLIEASINLWKKEEKQREKDKKQRKKNKEQRIKSITSWLIYIAYCLLSIYYLFWMINQETSIGEPQGIALMLLCLPGLFGSFLGLIIGFFFLLQWIASKLSESDD